ncbi:GNAT family N-acetyltransferase [Desulfosediminicola flagellatus]|uniref:GNAT family N-acetyltransferase n=1 Tax=Desulfosediminicola flagellatus TaxID=2569541 RepID=UPI0010AD9567|nr:N-acetyltransferase [Desulfosediminicola flagellatus]
MKIRKLTEDHLPKVQALLETAFPRSKYEERLVTKLHKNKRPLHEWVCIHRNMYIAYIAFSRAFNEGNVCGLHLAPIAVNPEYQKQGVGTELIKFALRQPEIKDKTLFVLGDPEFYTRFGFERCEQPICPFAKNNKNFLSIRNPGTEAFTVGYEPEF